ncbi:hypothetical protein [Clostridium hydrogenum]|uniref:hypothetical protein n=1 Tax=Clostridium hydrogenum TaxID=2855764 RepID=UPI001F480009|nr:hypothetical protein [Clostridium hydrogenum]
MRIDSPLKNDNKSKPKALSMLGASCFFTGRFEESYRIYNKLFLGDSIYFDEFIAVGLFINIFYIKHRK